MDVIILFDVVVVVIVLRENFDGGDAVELLALNESLVKFCGQFFGGGSVCFAFDEEFLKEGVEGEGILSSDLVEKTVDFFLSDKVGVFIVTDMTDVFKSSSFEDSHTDGVDF